MLTEAVVFVDYWRSLPPEEFLDWFGKHEPALVAFFGPLQTAGLVLTLFAVFAYAFPRREGLGLLAFAAALSVAVLGLYVVYFKEVNASFVTRSISVGDVAAELERWAAWQWARTGVGFGAFVAALLAVCRPDTSPERRHSTGGFP
jgi:hypothetical protein